MSVFQLKTRYCLKIRQYLVFVSTRVKKSGIYLREISGIIHSLIREMMQLKDVNRARIIHSILAVMLMAFGTGLILWPEQSFILVCRIAGGILIVYGIVKIICYFTRDPYQLAFQFDLAMGIFALILGITLAAIAEDMTRIFPTFIGIIFLVDAVFKIQTALDARRFGLRKWWFILILAVLAGIAGVVLIIHPLETSRFIMIVTGLNFFLDGVLNLWVVLYTVKIKRICRTERRE